MPIYHAGRWSAAALTLAAPALSQVIDVGAEYVTRFTLSASGTAGVGQLERPGAQPEVFRWIEGSGIESLLTPSGRPGTPVAISADGSIVCGTALGPSTAKSGVRWDASGTALDISAAGPVDTQPVAMSSDGDTIALSIRLADGTLHAGIWTLTGGTVDIHPTVGGLESRVLSLSQDGSTALLESSISGNGSDYFFWSNSTGVTAFPTTPVATVRPRQMSADGSAVCGFAATPTGENIFRWTVSGGFEFADGTGGGLLLSMGLSPDGSLVYGVFEEFLLGPTEVFFTWSPPNSLQLIDAQNSIQLASSPADGSALVGRISESAFSPGRAVRWTLANGLDELDPFSGESRATSVSLDGSRAGGTYRTTFGTRAVVWELDGNLGTSYCGPAVPNSTGAPGSISLGGSNVSEFGSLTLTASDLPQNTFGFFIVSRTRGFSAGAGGSQGNLCLGGAIGRFSSPGQIQNSGAGGSFTLEIDPRSIPSPSGPILPSFGETWHFQAWHRDANPSLTSNFTDGASIGIY